MSIKSGIYKHVINNIFAKEINISMKGIKKEIHQDYRLIIKEKDEQLKENKELISSLIKDLQTFKLESDTKALAKSQSNEKKYYPSNLID